MGDRANTASLEIEGTRHRPPVLSLGCGSGCNSGNWSRAHAKFGGGHTQMWLAQPKDREKPALLVVFSPRRGRATGGRVGENLAMVNGWLGPVTNSVEGCTLGDVS